MNAINENNIKGHFKKPKITISSKLLIFLKKRGILKEFRDTCEKFCDKHNLSEWRCVGLIDSFNWSSSPQGASYWIKLNDEFIDKQFKQE